MIGSPLFLAALPQNLNQGGGHGHWPRSGSLQPAASRASSFNTAVSYPLFGMEES